MQIRVATVPAHLRAQLSVYAEYRIFSRLASFARRIGRVDIVISECGSGTARCAVTADLGATGSVRASIERTQPIEAIDTAASALADLVARRLNTARGKECVHGH